MDHQAFKTEFDNSGLTQKAFADQKSMSPSMVHYYLKKASSTNTTSDVNRKGSFQEVTISQAASGYRQVTITMPHGVVIKIPV